MRKPSLWLLAGAIALVASLIVGPAATAKTERQSAGTVVIGARPGARDPQQLITEGNSSTTSLVTNTILGRADLQPEREAHPVSVAAPPKIVKHDPLTVTFRYKPTAVWSDGSRSPERTSRRPYNTIMNPNWDITSREGWEDIQLINATGKNVTVVWKKGKAYSAWDAIDRIVSASRATRSSARTSTTSGGTGSTSRAARSSSRAGRRGTQIVIAKNDAFKAGTAAKVDRIVFRYIPSTPSLFQALSSGEIQVTEPQPQLQIVDVQKNSKFKVQSGPGYFWEHMDIQFGPKGHPALKQKYVRQALVQGINREQIRTALYVAPGLVKSAKELPVLQSHIFKPFERYYQPNWASLEVQPDEGHRAVKTNGCTGGPDKPAANNSDVWSCPNVGKLSFRFTTTSGNQLRALTFEIAQKQLKSVGIELVPRFGPAGTVFGQIAPLG